MWTIVESTDYSVEHGGRSSEGVLAQGGGSQSLYLHVVELSEADLSELAPRVDEHGNREHDRLALPRNEEWWVAVAGEKTWPRLFRPKLRSMCVDVETKPQPAPLSRNDLARLSKAGVKGLP